MSDLPRSRAWAHARTAVVVAGLGFSGSALGVACLDYAGESYGTCAATNATGSGSGTDSTSSVGVGCDAGADATTSTTKEAGAPTGSGSHSF